MSASQPVNATKSSPIGSVQDGVSKNVDAKEVKPAEQIETDGKPEQKITTLAQLREYHIRNGTAITPAEVKKVKEIEEKALEEGGKKLRTNPKAETK